MEFCFKWIQSSQNSLEYVTFVILPPSIKSGISTVQHLYSTYIRFYPITEVFLVEVLMEKKQKFIKSLPLAHIRESQISSGKIIFPR